MKNDGKKRSPDVNHKRRWRTSPIKYGSEVLSVGSVNQTMVSKKIDHFTNLFFKNDLAISFKDIHLVS